MAEWAMCQLQRESRDREEKISALVDAVGRPLPLSDRMAAGDNRQHLEHLERLLGDWDTMVAHGRAISEDDIELLAALADLLGLLLHEQPQSLGARWIFRLREYLEDPLQGELGRVLRCSWQFCRRDAPWREHSAARERDSADAAAS